MIKHWITLFQLQAAWGQKRIFQEGVLRFSWLFLSFPWNEIFSGFPRKFFLGFPGKPFPGFPRKSQDTSNREMYKFIWEISGIPRFSWQFLFQYHPCISWPFPVLLLEKSQVFLGNMYKDFLGKSQEIPGFPRQILQGK